MEHRRGRVTLTLLMGAAFTALIAIPSIYAETLVYKAENKWVAPEDNKPLQSLLKAAHSGKTIYRVALPKDNRPLAIARLEILQTLLAREAKTAIVMEESGIARQPNTLEVNSTH